MRNEITTVVYTCDICEKESTVEHDFHTNKYSALYVARTEETGKIFPMELSSYHSVKLDLCNDCFKRSLDETIKMKTIGNREHAVYGFWKYDELKFA